MSSSSLLRVALPHRMQLRGVKLLHRVTSVYSILRADVLETEHFRMCLNAVEYKRKGLRNKDAHETT
jgi:hypothetical protein